MTDHQCVCQSAVRRLALIIGDAADQCDEFQEMVERFAMDWHSELGVAVVQVGPGCAFTGAAEVSDLLSGVLGSEATHQVRAAWLNPGPVETQMATLLRAETLAAFAPSRDSPLADLLDRRAISTWFQPIFDRDTRVWGYECLMRAHDEQGNLISPAQLISWARQDNLLFMLDRICREVHIANAARVNNGGTSYFLINFLPSVIYRPEFCLRTTVAALEKTTLPANQVCFEVVETEAIDDNHHLQEILDFYRAAGFRVALDDLAAGYSSLSLLADLDPDFVKIDLQVVQNTLTSEAYRNVCRGIVELGRRQNKQVLAEGIETEEQHAFLLDLGVDLFQGFLLGRPQPQ